MFRLRQLKVAQLDIRICTKQPISLQPKIVSRNFSTSKTIYPQSYRQLANQYKVCQRTMTNSVSRLGSGWQEQRKTESGTKNEGGVVVPASEAHQGKEPNHSHSHKESHSHSHSEGGLFSHSHSHSHQANELLSTNKETILSNPAVRITWIGLLVNISLVVTKGIGGIYFHSQSLIADAIHSISDMFADFLTLATVNVASRIGTPTLFPLGYGKIETIGSVLVSGVLLFAGVSVGWSSLLQVLEFTIPASMFEYVSMIQIGHSHSHGGLMNTSPGANEADHSHNHIHSSPEAQASTGTSFSSSSSSSSSKSVQHLAETIPNINAAWLAGGSIIIKELLYHKTMKVAQETNSKVLVANAWHHRVDSLTAAVAVVTVTGGNLFNVAWLDAIGGVCVSLLIIKAGWGTFKESLLELVDKGEQKDSELFSTIHDIITKEIREVANNDFEISKLSVLTSGAITNIYMTLTTESSYDLEKLNHVESTLVESIKKDDKFVRNVFVLFKKKPEQQKTLQDPVVSEKKS